MYLHDLTASLRSWQELLERAQSGHLAEPVMAETAARLGIARQLDRLFETDAALPHLRAVIDARPATPLGAVAEAHLQLGRALDRLGNLAEAVTAYRAAIATAPPEDPLEVADRARAGIRNAPATSEADAYRLSIDGLRALERGALDEAARALARSLALRPDDPVTRYRQAQLLLRQGDIAAALPVLEALVSTHAPVPPTIQAAACLDAARLHEQRGSLARATELYRNATTVFGADARTKDAAERALTRLAP